MAKSPKKTLPAKAAKKQDSNGDVAKMKKLIRLGEIKLKQPTVPKYFFRAKALPKEM